MGTGSTSEGGVGMGTDSTSEGCVGMGMGTTSEGCIDKTADSGADRNISGSGHCVHMAAVLSEVVCWGSESMMCGFFP